MALKDAPNVTAKVNELQAEIAGIDRELAVLDQQEREAGAGISDVALAAHCGDVKAGKKLREFAQSKEARVHPV